MTKWTFERIAQLGGRFHVSISKTGNNSKNVDFLRGVPVQLQSYSQADPFGDSTAVINFPQITGFDDLHSDDIGSWLDDFSNVDIWWIPAVLTKPAGWDLDLDNPYAWDYQGWRDPLTNDIIYAPLWEYKMSFVRDGHRGTKVWEGFIASMEVSATSTGSSLSVQCQGALFQADRYLEKPFFPARPQTLESMIGSVFSHKQRPNLRTKPMKIKWPTGWIKVGPPYSKNGANTFTPNITPGKKWTGYSSRQTGSWDHSLTSFVQNNLSIMITQDNCGAKPGNQWTLMLEREDPATKHPGRTPVLKVRDRFASPAFEIWLGTPGIDVSLSRDSTQMANVIYGDGTSVDGTVWRNATVSSNRTDYLPLAFDRRVYPPHDNRLFDRNRMVSEAYNKYGTAFDQTAATTSARKTLSRDMDPGWTGSVTFQIDPSDTLSRFEIQAGTPMRLKGFMGTGEDGLILHIASVEVNVQDGTVTLQVDTKFRDLLNLEEARARNRDPLTPAKLLQVNRASARVEDIMAPWDYSMGSGFVPRASKEMQKHKPNSITFPYQSWTQKHPPHKYPHWYVQVNADAKHSNGTPNPNRRWTQKAVQVLMSEKGVINRSEFCAYDVNGNVLKIPFHASVYNVQVHWDDMPMKDGVYSPFIHGAFETINPDTGFEWDKSSFLAPQSSFIVGWGNYRNKAGYSPGRATNGDQPTGKLVDDSDWNYDFTQYIERYVKPGWTNQDSSDHYAILSVWVMFYADREHGDVWFRGRFFHQNPGT